MRIALPIMLALMAMPGASAAHRQHRMTHSADDHPCQPIPIASSTLASRVTCRWLDVPLDHSDPGNPRRIRLAAYRIEARRPGARIGTLFFHPGSASEDPLQPLLDLAEQWGADPSVPGRAGLAALADHFDLVAIQPRGTGQNRLPCDRMPSLPARRYLRAPEDDSAWEAWIDSARTFTASCGPGAAFISTRQTLGDMEALRVSMGASRLHFYARGRGAWTVTWYAAVYPQNTVRTLLDGATSFHLRRWPEQTRGHLVHRERMLRETLVQPLVASPGGELSGQDGSDIMQRLRHMPLILRRAWQTQLLHPVDIVAALSVADLWRSGTPDTVLQRIQQNTFHGDAFRNASIRRAATRLVETMPMSLTGHADDSMLDGASIATLCNDSVWNASMDRLRDDDVFHRDTFSLPDTHAIVHGVTCHAWPFRTSLRPSLRNDTSSPPIMMIHAGLDHASPPGGIEGVAQDYAQAHLIIESSLAGQPVLGQPDSRCATPAAITYLLQGTVPEKHITRCQ